MRQHRPFALFALTLSLALVSPLIAQEPVDLDTLGRIRQESYQRSKARQLLSELCDGIGPRLTGSPNYREASEWAQARLKEFGLVNVRSESFAPFGRGWTFGRSVVTMRAPDVAILPAIPKAWTPGTDGIKRGKAVFAPLAKDEDLARWKGKLEGMVVFLDEAPELKPREEADAKRHDAASLEKLERFEAGGRGRGPRRDRKKMMEEYAFAEKRTKFLAEEKPLAVVSASRGDDGTIFVGGGGPWEEGKPSGPPALSMAAESYGRVVRLLERKVEVELELEIEASFTPPDPEAAANVIAELPGSDRKGEVVMVGAHLDSWHAGTGTTDNGVGVVVAMETVRILKALGVTPRRTILIGLWGGEEQGFLGSRAFVSKHLASRPEPTDLKEKEVPAWLRRSSGPLTFHPGWKTFSAYFNMDNGAGRLRGIHAQENLGVRPLFEAWLEPLKDLGATTVTMRNTGGTDHIPFDSVGLPGFQFIQDSLDYGTRTHHSNWDVFERAPEEDLQQAAAVMASFVWQAANRPSMLPRKPVPPERPREDEDAKEKPAAPPVKAPEVKQPEVRQPEVTQPALSR